MRASLVTFVAIGVVGCGRVDFGVATVGDGGGGADADLAASCAAMGATYCDDFSRTTPIADDDPVWQQVICTAPASSLAVDGTLAVSYGAFDGMSVVQCQLISNPVPDVRTLQLDFDITLDAGASPASTIIANPTINLATPNAMGVAAELIQLTIDPSGFGGIALVQYFPDAALSPSGSNFPGYDMADSNGLPWVTVGTPCHVTLLVDMLGPLAGATSDCQLNPLVERVLPAVTGITGPLTLSFGYSNTGHVTAGGTITYDNMVLRTGP